jgi:hypothetical protein
MGRRFDVVSLCRIFVFSLFSFLLFLQSGTFRSLSVRFPNLLFFLAFFNFMILFFFTVEINFSLVPAEHLRQRNRIGLVLVRYE